MILVVIIVVAWMIILGPNLLKRRAAGVGGINSISHFRRQLRVLEQSAPQPLVPPAFRLRSVDGSALPPGGDGGSSDPVTPKLSVVGADQLPRPALAFLGRDPSGSGGDPDDGIGAVTMVGPPPGARVMELDGLQPGGLESVPSRPTIPASWSGPSSRAPDNRARYQARRRRRDTLGVLTLIFVTTVLIGFIPGATVAWALSLVSGLALVAYVALLVRMRQMAEEREHKLRYLRPGVSSAALPDFGGAAGHQLGRGGDAAFGVADLPVRISGRYAHPSNQAALAR